MTTTYVTLLIGYSLAGPLLKYIGYSWSFIVCAILFLLATLSTYKLSNFDKKDHALPSLVNIAGSITRVWHESMDGLKYFRNRKQIVGPMIKLTIGWVVLGAFITLLPAFSDSVLMMNPKLIGTFIIAPAGLGMVLAVLYLNRKRIVPNEKTINRGFIIVGTALLLFSLYKYYSFISFKLLILLFLVVLLGFGSSFVQVPAQTLLHINSEEDKRGRVFGFSSMQLRLATTLPALVVGGLADLTSPMITMIILAVLVFLYSMILAFE
jgi:predicted MFS family arabinose efflux permease